MSSGLDLLGWLGGGMAAVAYVLVSTRRVVPDAALFQGLNIVGAMMLGAAAFHSGAVPSAAMNGVWILFGMQSLITSAQRRRREALAAVVAERSVVRHTELNESGPDLAEDAVLAA